jgi:signal transduction histidine kinase
LDPAENPVGGMVVLYDLREERQRKQQLSVLNRVLRHNLRNEMTVIQGYAESLERALTDPTHREHAATISRAGDRLLAIGEKVREFDQIQDQVSHPERVDLEGMVTRLYDQLSGQFPAATIETDIAVSETTIHTQQAVLELALTNLVENALKHAAETEPWVHIRMETVRREEPTTVIEVRDDNAPIPEDEIAVLKSGAETPLQHGQGIGLWIVNWCVVRLNGDIEYRYDEGNRFEMTVPTV